MTLSGLPADLEMDVADMERTLERLRTATSVPGPPLELTHDVMELNRQFINVRRWLTRYFVRHPLKGAFCGKTVNQVERLIAGPGVTICEECVSLCVSILADKGVELPPPYPEPA